MVDRRQSRGQKAPVTSARRAAASAAPAAPAENAESPLLWGAFGLHAVLLFSIMVSMTALTHNLDDIKVTMYFVFGPLLMLSALALIWFKIAPPPPMLITIGLVGYLVVTVISSLFAQSNFKWICNFYIQFNWIAAGFFLSAMCIASQRKSAEYFLRFMVLQILAVNLIGFFMYNLTGGGAGVQKLYEALYPAGDQFVGEPSNFFRLLMTLSGPAQNDMQSTILNRDFYAGLALLFLPFPMLMMLDPGPGRRPNLWRAIAFVTTVLDLVTIFYCFSKGEWIFTAIAIPMFAILFYFHGQVRGIQSRHMVALLVGLGILMGTVGFLRSPEITSRLKTVKDGFNSREIIWGGAWEMFKESPRSLAIGQGPGTFRMYFPKYRRADYFNNGISHVTTFSHNLFLDILAETGVAGFGAYMLMLGALWLMGLYWAIKHPDPRIRNILIACVTSMVGIYGSNLSSPNARWVIGTVNIWTVMGFMAGIILMARRPGVERPMSAMEGARQEPDAELKMKWALGALLALGLVIGGFSTATGMRYWASAKSYAKGLTNMETAMAYIERGFPDEYVQGLLEKAGPLLEKSIEQEKYNTSSYYKLGSVYTTLCGIYQRQAQALMAKDPAAAQKQSQLSDRCMELALKRYAELEKINPDYAQIHYNLGIVYEQYAEYLIGLAQRSKNANPEYMKEAQNFADKALEEIKKNAAMSDQPEAVVALGTQYMRVGNYKEACEVYAKGAEKYPADVIIVSGYLRAAEAANDMRGFTLALEMLWNLDPTEKEGQLAGYSTVALLLNTAVEHGIDDVLTRTLTRLEKMNPADLRLLAARIELARRNNDPDEILRQIEMYRRAGGEGNQYYSMAYLAAKQLGDTKRANDLAALIRKHGGIVPTSPTTSAAPAAKPAAQPTTGTQVR